MRKWSVFTRVGGKYKVREKISEFFPQNYDTFVELFAGGGQLLLHLLQNEYNPKVKYIINDKNPEIYHIWKDIKNVSINELKSKDWRGSKTRFNILKSSKPKKAVDRLYRNLYLSWYSYGAMNDVYADKKRVRGGHLWKILEELQKKLKKVIVLNKDYTEVIKEYDSPTTLIYADPPYYNKEHLYEGQSVDPEKLAETLRGIKGKVVISYNIVPEVSKEFKDFHFYKIKVPYSASEVKENKYEYIITNFGKTKGGRIQQILFEVDHNKDMCKFCKRKDIDEDTIEKMEKFLKIGGEVDFQPEEVKTFDITQVKPKGVWFFWNKEDMSPLSSISPNEPITPYITRGQETRNSPEGEIVYDVITISCYYKENIAIGIGWQKYPRSKKLGYHPDDIEFVSIYYQNNEPKKVYFSQHSIGQGEGRWVNYSDCEVRDDYLVVYVARNSHGMFPRARLQIRVFGLANDITEATGPNQKYTWDQMLPSYDWDNGHGIRLYKNLRPPPPDTSLSEKQRILRIK